MQKANSMSSEAGAGSGKKILQAWAAPKQAGSETLVFLTIRWQFLCSQEKELEQEPEPAPAKKLPEPPQNRLAPKPCFREMI